MLVPELALFLVTVAAQIPFMHELCSLSGHLTCAGLSSPHSGFAPIKANVSFGTLHDGSCNASDSTKHIQCTFSALSTVHVLDSPSFRKVLLIR